MLSPHLSPRTAVRHLSTEVSGAETLLRSHRAHLKLGGAQRMHDTVGWRKCQAIGHVIGHLDSALPDLWGPALSLRIPRLPCLPALSTWHPYKMAVNWLLSPNERSWRSSLVQALCSCPKSYALSPIGPSPALASKGSLKSSISTTWELVRNVTFQAPAQT